MDELLGEMKRAVAAEMHYSALMLALVLIDVCSALEDPRGRTSGAKYVDWVRRNLPQWETAGKAQLLYRFRCRLLHEGSMREERDNARLAFYLPNRHDIRIHGPGTFEMTDRPDVTVVDIELFCDEVAEAVAAWRAGVENTTTYQRNAERLVRRYPSREIVPFLTAEGDDLEVIA